MKTQTFFNKVNKETVSFAYRMNNQIIIGTPEYRLMFPNSGKDEQITILNNKVTSLNKAHTADSESLFKEPSKKGLNTVEFAVNNLLRLAPALGSDDLRPIFDAININADESRMYGTNAHVIKQLPCKAKKTVNIMVKPILSILNQFKNESIKITYGEKWSTFILPGNIRLQTMNEVNIFPTVKNVLPDRNNYEKRGIKVNLKEIKPFINMNGNHIMIIEGNKGYIKSDETDITKEFTFEWMSRPNIKFTEMIMPVKIEDNTSHTIEAWGLNIKMLCKTWTGDVILTIEHPSKAILVDEVTTTKNQVKQVKKEVKQAPKVKAKEVQPRSELKNKLELIDYSDRAFAIKGDTRAIKDTLKELGGRFNPYLKDGDTRFKGWIFSKKRLDVVKSALKM